jgi:hypothetical protein
MHVHLDGNQLDYTYLGAWCFCSLLVATLKATAEFQKKFILWPMAPRDVTSKYKVVCDGWWCGLHGVRKPVLLLDANVINANTNDMRESEERARHTWALGPKDHETL